MSNTLNRVS